MSPKFRHRLLKIELKLSIAILAQEIFYLYPSELNGLRINRTKGYSLKNKRLPCAHAVGDLKF